MFRGIRITIVSISFLFVLFIPRNFSETEFPVLRVVIDPGHGGSLLLSSRKKHGDRYDVLSRSYLDDFRPGASFGALKEHKIVYNIGDRVFQILQYAAPGGDFRKFEKIAKKYGVITRRVNIVSIMSRPKGIDAEQGAKFLSDSGRDDPNAPYRLFDYPDAYNVMQEGRISRMNKFRPHLVVSIHLALSGEPTYRAMNPVLIAPFPFLAKGLKYLRGQTSDRSFFDNSQFKNWFVEEETRSPFRWFLSDVSQYFTGYQLDAGLNIRENRFRGYLRNMVRWSYADEPGWQTNAELHAKYSPYSMDFHNVSPAGKFWDRERSKYELFKRDGGEEGFGGDNAYASYEIIRYILSSLKQHGVYNKNIVPGRPYVSIWAIPMHINAINAYFELGYLRRKVDRKMLTENQNEIAEGIAVGIYSLLAGIEPKESDFTHRPRGKRIDLEKYNLSTEKNYFDMVWSEKE